LLSERAVAEYLSAALDTFDWIKRLPDDELNAEVNSLGISFQLPLFRHQKEMFLLGASLGEFLFFADMGLGKSAVALNLIRYFFLKNRAKALVCVPNLVNIDNWYREAKIHAPEIKLLPLYGSSTQRLEKIVEQDADVYVINYAGLVAMFSSIQSVGKEEKRVVDNEMVDAFSALFDTLVLDESHKIKNIQSYSYRICNRISAHCSQRFCMTGTPLGVDPQDLWGQFKIVDQGNTLGRTMTLFREGFFVKKKNHWGQYEYNFKKRMTDRLNTRLKNRSIRYEASDCNDLPERIVTLIDVPFPKENYAYYLKTLEMIKDAKNDIKKMDNPYNRLRQLTSGYLSHKTGDGDKFEIEFDEKPKLDALLELIDELPPGRKMVVFHEYIQTGKIISEALSKIKVNHVRLYGGTKDKQGTLAKFLDDPKCRVLVVNNESGGTGLNLQVANYMVLFEMPRSTITHAQVLKRLYRTGQTRTTFVYYLRMQKSIDIKIYEAWLQGKEFFANLIDAEEIET